MSNRQKSKHKQQSPIKFRDFWEIDDDQVASSYRKLWHRIGTGNFVPVSPAINWWKMATVAASVALLIVSGLYWHERGYSVPQPVEMVYATDKPSQITLSDGTKVWLSARSQLRYQEIFAGKTRDVRLKGEAYFEVQHNAEHPFRVLTSNNQKVVVLGTCFNVRAYDNEPDITIALVEGSIEMVDCNREQQSAIMLKPGQHGRYVKLTGVTTVADTNIEMLMSWKTGHYVFNNQPFEEIAHTLEKGFNVTIRIENEKLKTKPYTMRFENGESLEKILDLIKVNAKYGYQYENGIIVIR